MAWMKVDDKLHDHRKVRSAGSAAMGVWLLAGSWSADHGTDGFIPAGVLSRWGRPRDAARLVAAGLWHDDEQDGERGWRFHDWLKYQPSRAQREEASAKKAEAGRLGGRQSGRSRRQAAAKQSASGLVEPPYPTRTRPVPVGSNEPTTTPSSDTSDAAPGKPVADIEPETFADWWDVFDHKVGRAKAITAYRRALKKSGVTPELLIAAAREYIAWQRRENKHPEFTKHPTTWLNGEHWNDERAASKTPAPGDATVSDWLPHVDDLESPPDDATDEQIAQWYAERRNGPRRRHD